MSDDELLKSIGMPVYDDDISKMLDRYYRKAERVEAMPENTREEVEAKRAAMRKVLAGIRRMHHSQDVRDECRAMRQVWERKD